MVWQWDESEYIDHEKSGDKLSIDYFANLFYNIFYPTEKVVFILSRREKIVTCCSVWHAYRDALTNVNRILLRKPYREMAKEERLAFEAYKDLIFYELLHKDAYAEDFDVINYRRAYCDALRFYNILNAIDSRVQAAERYDNLEPHERRLMTAFRNILLVASDKRQKIGHFNHAKVYNFTKKLDAVLNFKNRGRK